MPRGGGSVVPTSVLGLAGVVAELRRRLQRSSRAVDKVYLATVFENTALSSHIPLHILITVLRHFIKKNDKINTRPMATMLAFATF